MILICIVISISLVVTIRKLDIITAIVLFYYCHLPYHFLLSIDLKIMIQGASSSLMIYFSFILLLVNYLIFCTHFVIIKKLWGKNGIGPNYFTFFLLHFFPFQTNVLFVLYIHLFCLTIINGWLYL